MRNKVSLMVLVVIISFLISLMGDIEVQAGSKGLISGKRTKYQDNKSTSMRDVFAQKEIEEDEFREKVLLNSDETIELLTQIRDLLKSLNEKENSVVGLK